MEIGRDCPRFEEFGAYFMHRPSLQDAICNYYISIVTLCKKVVAFCNNNGLAKISTMLFHSFAPDFQSIQSELKDRSTNVIQEISLAAKKASIAESSASASFRNVAMKLVGDLSGEVDAARSLQDRLNFLNACSEYKFNRVSYRQARRHGSVFWFQSDHDFLEWISSPESGVILCTGILGSGKTVLAANVVEHVIEKNDSASTTYFFCRHDYEESCRASVILGTMLRELLESIEYDVAGTGFKTSSVLDCDDMIKAFLKLPGRPYKFVLVVDGLDECDPKELKLLLRSLRTLVKDSVHLFSIFCTCRNDLADSVARILRPKWSINMAKQDEEMGEYISKALESRLEDGDLVLQNLALVIHIFNELLIGAHGMILWVTLQLDDICSLNSDAEILHALQDLPKDLPETYSRILRRLRSSHRSTELPSRMFRTIAAAKRPLHLEELRECLNITPGHTEWCHDSLASDIRKTVGHGGSLLFIDEETFTVHFTHHSVFQFLASLNNPEFLDFHFARKDIDTELGERCITYMFLDILDLALSRSTERGDRILNSIPNAIVQHQPSRGRRLSQAITLLRRNTSGYEGTVKVQQVLEETAGRSDRPIFEPRFLDYTLVHWVAHSRMLHPKSGRVWRLFDRICNQEVDLYCRFPDRKVNHLNLNRKEVFHNNHVALLRFQLMKYSNSFEFSTIDLEPLVRLASQADFAMVDEMAKSDSLSDSTKWQLIYPIILADRPEIFWQLYYRLVPLDRDQIGIHTSKVPGFDPRSIFAKLWLPKDGNQRSGNWSLTSSNAMAGSDALDDVYPLSFAMVAGKTNIFRSLISHGHLHDSRFIPPQFRGTSAWPLVLFREALSRQRFKAATILFNTGEIPTNGFDDQGKPPLYWAIEYNHEDLSRGLIQLGAEPRYRLQNGRISDFNIPDKYKVDLDSRAWSTGIILNDSGAGSSPVELHALT